MAKFAVKYGSKSNNKKGKFSSSSKRVHNIAYGAQLAKDGKTDTLNKILSRDSKSAHNGINRAKNNGVIQKFF